MGNDKNINNKVIMIQFLNMSLEKIFKKIQSKLNVLQRRMESIITADLSSKKQIKRQWS